MNLKNQTFHNKSVFFFLLQSEVSDRVSGRLLSDRHLLLLLLLLLFLFLLLVLLLVLLLFLLLVVVLLLLVLVLLLFFPLLLLLFFPLLLDIFQDFLKQEAEPLKSNRPFDHRVCCSRLFDGSKFKLAPENRRPDGARSAAVLSLLEIERRVAACLHLSLSVNKSAVKDSC